MNDSENCYFCGDDGGERGDWAPCACGYGRTLGCAGKPSCGNCEEAHRKAIGPYIRALLKTRIVQRSNSRRARLFHGLYSAICATRKVPASSALYRDAPPAFSGTFLLQQISPFDTSDSAFRAAVLETVRSSSIRLNQKFADQLYSNDEASTAMLEPLLNQLMRG